MDYNEENVYVNTLGSGMYYKSQDSQLFKKVEFPSSLPNGASFIWDIENI